MVALEQGQRVTKLITLLLNSTNVHDKFYAYITRYLLISVTDQTKHTIT